MPYALPDGAGPGTTGVQLRVDTPRRFTLTTPFWYAPFRPLPPQLDALLPSAEQRPAGQPADGEQHWLHIPSGSTDLASVPGVLWGLVASYGRHTLAVLVHDHVASLADPAPEAERFDRSSAADEVFYAALRDPEAGQYRAPWFRSLVLWAGVSLTRYYRHRRAGFAALAAATVGAWLALGWLAENVGGRPFPLAAWIVLAMALVVLGVAGVLATRLSRLQPHGVAPDPAYPTALPPRAQDASFLPEGQAPVVRASDIWVVRGLAIAAILLLIAAGWLALPLRPLFGVGVPGFLAFVGLVAFLAGSGYLSRSPIRRDGALPAVVALAGPPIGVVALITAVALYLLWLPDAFSTTGEGPLNSLDRGRTRW
ncbi:MAG: DUF1353 domain-containing protein [Micropruina sp.]|uniref:DUF1353 domain-containing protein n=1 Tax=Micropruina sp. TaxID=2737536 RepID=UPI0039E64AFF